MDDTAKDSDPIHPRDARIAQLEARIAELEEIINRLHRGGKRQAAPFSKGLPKPSPNKVGRKSGEGYGKPPVFRSMPAPAASDQVINVPPPETCPHCGECSTTDHRIDQQVQHDIEIRTRVRRFGIKVVRCGRCGKLRRGKHPLQTSMATGCCASQVGPLARSAMAFMNKTLGTSLGKIARLSATLLGLTITPRACYELPGQFASRASMTTANTAKCIPFNVAASRS
jgi:transposase